MDLKDATYVCLDIPEPFYSAVREIREAHCDRLDNFPIEMTVAGSSGVGAIRATQSWTDVKGRLIQLCEHTPQIQTEFAGVVRFPGTDTFVLSLRDPMPFQAFHEALQAAIEFEPSPFPFFPHCSLRMSGPLSEDDINELFRLRLEGEFTVDTLSLYQMRNSRVVRVWEHPLATPGKSAKTAAQPT